MTAHKTIQAVRSQMTEAQKIASGSGSEQDIAEAKIELEVISTVSSFPDRELKV